jgi:Glycosyltransferase family 87
VPDVITRRRRWIAAVVVVAVHLALLVPAVGENGGVLHTDFGPEAEAIEGGALPYGDEDLEYPPLSIPVIVAPAWFGEGLDSYNDAFQVQMLLVDLGIVLLLALALPGTTRHVWAALAVYTLGIVSLSGIVFGGSDLEEAPLALDRFDLWPALLVLAAALAREAGRSATWAALLSAGVALKAYPVALFPALLRGERNLGRVAIAAAVPLVAAAAIVLGFGDEFGSAIGYHTERALQVEAVAATPLEIAAINDVAKGAEYGSGSFNFVAAGADTARAISIGLLVTSYALVLWAGWRTRVSHLKLVTALLAVILVFSPVLSPQFLFWLLPLSAAAYGLSAANVVLVLACVMTQLMLQFYARVVVDFDPEFVWRLAGRNALLLLYAAIVCLPIVLEALRTGEADPEAGLARQAT